ncbi:Tn3 family transposase [Viridibacillus sp. YIM B01967]|uniref:Tn3 family transposase n=1 Tax=Viridibacillus soli TaxID=2798301 RepID=A0ABS1H840_9BACL|nr:Tn3 family transposase [Viridibacillus soli]
MCLLGRDKSNEELNRRIQQGLNKRETINHLARILSFKKRGPLSHTV